MFGKLNRTWKKKSHAHLWFSCFFLIRRASSCKYLVGVENGSWPVVDPPGMDTTRSSPLFKVGRFYIRYLIFNLLIATTGKYLLDQLLGLDSLKVARAAKYNIYFILVGTRQMIMRWSILVGASWWPFGNGFARKMIRILNLSRIHLIFWVAILSVRLLIKRGSYWHSKLLYLSVMTLRVTFPH